MRTFAKTVETGRMMYPEAWIKGTVRIQYPGDRNIGDRRDEVILSMACEGLKDAVIWSLTKEIRLMEFPVLHTMNTQGMPYRDLHYGERMNTL